MRKTVKGMRRWTKEGRSSGPLKGKSKERRRTKTARQLLKSWARTDNSFAEGIPSRHASRASKPHPQVYPQRRIRVPSLLKRIFHDTYTPPPAKCQSTCCCSELRPDKQGTGSCSAPGPLRPRPGRLRQWIGLNSAFRSFRNASRDMLPRSPFVRSRTAT